MQNLRRFLTPFLAVSCLASWSGFAAGSGDGAFIENAGQWDSHAQFLASLPGVDVWVTERGAVYDFHRLEKSPDRGPQLEDIVYSRPPAESPRYRRFGHVVRMEFVGGKPSPVSGIEQLEAKSHYFSGNDPSNWVTNVRRFGEARSERVYDGIEARWYTDGGNPRYDLIVAPGADPRQIALRFEGATRLSTDGRTLRLETSLGEVRHQDLVAFQNVGGARKLVDCRMKVRGNELRFEAGAYDKSKPLVIDPLVWSTFIGSGVYDYVYDIAADSQSNAVIAGQTGAYGFPVTEGAYNVIQTDQTAYISKFEGLKGKLLWSTFLTVADGGVGIRGLALAPDGGVWLTGSVAGKWFPTTAGAFSRVWNPSGADAFVSRLSSDGSQLLASTYLGGAVSDVAMAITVDSSGRPIVVGQTLSSNFPVTAGAFDTTFEGYFDGFVSRLSADCKRLEASTFLGGMDNAQFIGTENITGVAVDSLGRVVVCGTTPSSSFPTTTGAIRTTGVHTEGFVTRLSSGLKTLYSSTLVGGNAGDGVARLAIDAGDNAIVVGSSNSTDFPTTSGAFSETLAATGIAFVVKINPQATTLLRSTRWPVDSLLRDVALTPDGKIVVVGTTTLQSFPTTLDGFDTTFAGFSNEGTVSLLDPSLGNLLYSALVGGSDTDEMSAAAAAPDGSILVTGDTWSSDLATTAGAFQRTHWGATDVYVMKIGLRKPTTLALSKTTLVGGFGLEGTVTIDQPAPTLGAKVILSSKPAILGLPAFVKLGAGKTSKTFSIGTPAVASKTVVKVTASAGGTSVTQSLTLTVGGLIGLSVNPTSVTRGSSSTGTVTLSAKAPSSGRKVSLTVASPFITVPATVTVPAGATFANFQINTDAGGPGGVYVISAKLGTSVKEASLTVNP